MNSTAFVASFSIKILSNLAYDLLKRARGAACAPVDRAIGRTVELFREIEGLKRTLEQWLASPAVNEVLEEYTKGFKGFDDVRIDFLGETLLANTQFFLPDSARVTAQEIVSRFLAEVLNEYLATPELAPRIIVNRLEMGFARCATDFNALSAGLEEVKARLPAAAGVSDGGAFDSQINEAKRHLEKYEYELAEHVCMRLRECNWDRLNARQKFRTLSIIAAANLAEGRAAEGARHLIEAKAWQPDDERALGNEARAYDLLGQKQRAFELATRAREQFPNSALALAVWLNTAPAWYPLKDLEDAVPAHLAVDIEVVSALAYRALVARDNAKAEALARRATAIRADWSFPWALLGESIFRSTLPDAPEDYACLDSLADRGRLREAEEACTKAMELAKAEKQPSVQARVLLIRAEARRGLGDRLAGDEDVIAAWSLEPDDPTVLLEYARLKLQHGEKQHAVEKLRPAVKRDDREDLRMLLALALSSTGKEEDRAEAAQIYESLATQQRLQPTGYRIHAILAALDGFSKGQRWNEGRAFLARVPAGSVWGTASTALQAKWELAAGNRDKASELATKAIAAITENTISEDLRLAATVLADLGRHRDALPLWQRLASPRYLGYDTSRLIDCALRLGQHDVFLTLCEHLRSNGVYDKQLVEVEAGVREHYDLEGAISLLQDYLSRSPEDRAARLHLSAIGSQLGRPELVASDPASMPAPGDVQPENWKVIVLVMKSGGHLLEALRFAYLVLRRNFREAEAHRAYLAAMLVTGPRPDIPSVDVAGPGTAIASREEGTTQEEWRVIEEEFEPDPGLQEIGPDHFIATQLKGKRVGETFLLAQGPLTSTRGTITQILSKYVYRFQDCTANWQKRFPGLPDIQSLRVVKFGGGGREEIDLTEFFASLDRLIGHQQEAIAAYRSQPIPIHLLARAMSRTDFEQTIRVAVDDQVSVRCCAGSAQERAEAILALKNASAVVLDVTAIATLSLLGALDELQRFPAQLLVSQLTLAELRMTLGAHTSDDGDMGRLGKEGDRWVLERDTPETLRSRSEFLQSTVEKICSRCNIMGCPELAAVPPDDREFLVKAIGEHGAQSVVLASASGRVLWTDDFAVAMIAKHKFGVRRAWTQVALQERTEAGAIRPETFFEVSAKLIGWRYYFTSPSTPALARAGSLAEWNPGRRPLRPAVELFSDTGIATRDALALVVSFMVHYATDVVLPEVRNALTVQILENLAKRGDGLTLIQALISALPLAFGLNVVRAREFGLVIRAWIATKQPIRWR